MNRQSPWFPVALVGIIVILVIGWKSCSETAVTPVPSTPTLPRLPTLLPGTPTARVTSLPGAATATSGATIEVVATRPVPTGAVQKG